MISFEAVRHTFDRGVSWAVDELSLEVREGELLALLGESGCGKTTTLKMVNRLVTPSSGRVRVAGEDVMTVDPVSLRRRIGYAIQSVGLFPHRTVAQNIATVPRLLGWSDETVAERVAELLALMKLAPDCGSRRPATLSGGQAQRVGLARALAAKPRVMLLDEPFGSVDPVTREGLQREYRRLHEALGLTTVLVTHDVTEALLLADRLAILVRGRLVALGAPQQLSASAHPQVEALLALPRRQAAAVQERLSKARAP